MEKPKLLLYVRGLKGTTIKRINLAYLKYFYEMGLDVTQVRLSDNELNEQISSTPGLKLGKHYLEEDWNDYDIVALASFSVKQLGHIPFVQNGLEKIRTFKGRLAIILDDPRDQVWHWGLNGANKEQNLDLVHRGYDLAFCLPDKPDGYIQSEWSRALLEDVPLVPFSPYGFVQDLSNPDFTNFKQRATRAYYYGLYKPSRWKKIEQLFVEGKDLAYFGKHKPLKKQLPTAVLGKVTNFDELRPQLLNSNASLIIGCPGHTGSLTMRLPEALECGAVPLIDRELDPQMTIMASKKFYFSSGDEFDDIIASVTIEDMREQIISVQDFSRNKAKLAFDALCKLL